MQHTRDDRGLEAFAQLPCFANSVMAGMHVIQTDVVEVYWLQA